MSTKYCRYCHQDKETGNFKLKRKVTENGVFAYYYEEICKTCLKDDYKSFTEKNRIKNKERKPIKQIKPKTRQKLDKRPKLKEQTRLSENRYKRNSALIKKEMFDKYGYYFCLRCQRTLFRFFVITHHIIFRSEKPKHKHLHNKRNLFICCEDCHKYLHEYKYLGRKHLITTRKLLELFGSIFSKD